MSTFGTSKQPPGVALVIVMLVTAVLLLAGASFLTISSTEMQIALNERAAAQAALLAEAAIHKGLARLNTDPLYAGERDSELGGGKFTITVMTSAQQSCPGNTGKDLVATASLPVTGGAARAEIRATADKVSYPFRWAAFAAAPENSLLEADRRSKELWVGNTSTVDSFDSTVGAYDPNVNRGASGNVGANGDVTVDYNTQVMGDLTAGGDIIEGAGVTVSGGRGRRAPAEQFQAVASGMSDSGLKVESGSTTELDAGTHHYRNLEIGNGASLTVSGPVTIYVTGPPIDMVSGDVVRVGDNVTLGSEPGAKLRIITKSDGTPGEAVRFWAGAGFKFYGGLYGTNTDIYLGENPKIFGSIIGRTIMTGAGTGLHYDQAMSNQEVCHNGSFTIRRGTWREVIP